MKPGKIVILVFVLAILSLFSSYIKKMFDYIFGKICINYNNIAICINHDAFKDKKINLLKNVGNNLITLLKYLKTLESSNVNIKRLLRKIGNNGITKIEEIVPISDNSHYTENNGRTLKLCLGKSKVIEYEEDIIDLNSLMFVVLHELAHTMTLEKGHTKEFMDNWKLLLQEAVKLNIYTFVDYKKNARSYCSVLLENDLFIN